MTVRVPALPQLGGRPFGGLRRSSDVWISLVMLGLVAVLIVVLAVRPQGILGGKQVDKV